MCFFRCICPTCTINERTASSLETKSQDLAAIEIWNVTLYFIKCWHCAMNWKHVTESWGWWILLSFTVLISENNMGGLKRWVRVPKTPWFPENVLAPFSLSVRVPGLFGKKLVRFFIAVRKCLFFRFRVFYRNSRSRSTLMDWLFGKIFFWLLYNQGWLCSWKNWATLLLSFRLSKNERLSQIAHFCRSSTKYELKLKRTENFVKNLIILSYFSGRFRFRN